MKKRTHTLIILVVLALLVSLISCDPEFGKFIEGENVVFNDTGDAPVEDQFTVGYVMELTSIPTKAGYTFGGWYTDTSYTTMWDIDNDRIDKTLNLYAKWTATVTYDSQNATTNSSPISQTVTWTSGTDTVGTLPTGPQKTGYTFGGWYTAANGGGTAFGASTAVTGTLTLYAKWTADSYAVTFDVQSGTGGSANTTATYDAPMLSGLTAPSRTGYTFGGYYDQANGAGMQYYTDGMASSNAWNKTENTTLYAKWTISTYTVSYNANGATSGSAPSAQTKTYGIDLTLATNSGSLARTGYTFAGWNTAANGSGTDYATGATYSTNAALPLYAKWTPNTYTITFDVQSGAGGSASTTATYDAAMLSGLTAPTRTGYTFAGYYDQANGAGTQYYTDGMASSNAWDKAANTTLYAKWTIDTYTVSYNANSATSGSAPSAQTKTYGIDLTLATNSESLTKTGYTFAGWNTAANGSGTDYATGATYTTNAALTLYAKWTPNTYTVTFDVQSGTGGSASTTATYDTAMLSGLTAPTRTGYTFAGYYDQANGAGTQYYTAGMASSNAWDKAANTILFAKWTVNTYTVTFDMQSGTGGSASTTATYGAVMPVASAPSRTGYTFGGYYDQANGAGTQYYTDGMASSNAWDKAANTILYAKWTPNTYTVTFDVQNGTGGSASTTATYGAAMPLALTAPIRTGYTFGGYYDQANGAGTQYYTAGMASSNAWDKTANTTLYAKWTAIVGELGPSGGYVFYDKGSYSNGWRYLEAAPYGWKNAGTDDPTVEWGAGDDSDPYEANTYATAVGTGETNTSTIVAYHNSLATAYPLKGDYYSNPTNYNSENDGTVAAKVCYEYSMVNEGITYDDWFLPSKDELALMYTNLKLNSKGNFSLVNYWSSSEDSRTNYGPFNMNFGSGTMFNNYKYLAQRVRPIRAF